MTLRPAISYGRSRCRGRRRRERVRRRSCRHGPPARIRARAVHLDLDRRSRAGGHHLAPALLDGAVVTIETIDAKTRESAWPAGGPICSCHCPHVRGQHSRSLFVQKAGQHRARPRSRGPRRSPMQLRFRSTASPPRRRTRRIGTNGDFLQRVIQLGRWHRLRRLARTYPGLQPGSCPGSSAATVTRYSVA